MLKNQWSCLDLSEHFNHKAFVENDASDSSANNCGLNSSLEFFVLDSFDSNLTPNGLLINKIPFSFPKVGQSVYDNIQCDRQIVNVHLTNVRSIAILGYSVISNFHDNIKVKGADDSIIRANYDVLRWDSAGYRQDNPKSCGYSYDDNEFSFDVEAVLFGCANTDSMAGFSLSVIDIGRVDIEYIQLPENFAIHIVGITMI